MRACRPFEPEYLNLISTLLGSAAGHWDVARIESTISATGLRDALSLLLVSMSGLARFLAQRPPEPINRVYVRLKALPCVSPGVSHRLLRCFQRLDLPLIRDGRRLEYGASRV